MDVRKLLTALVLGTALAATGTAVMAKERGGHESAQHESVGNDSETRDGKAGGRDVETADDHGGGSAVGESRGGPDPDNIQFEDRGDHGGDNGVPYLKR